MNGRFLFERLGLLMINTIEIKNRVIGEGIPKICVPLVGRTSEEIIAQAQKLASVSKVNNIDIAEFRADFFKDLADPDRLSSVLNKLRDILQDNILLFTIRSETEGGEKLATGCPSIFEINRFIIENRLADMVDMELFSCDESSYELIELAHSNGIKIIMSNHDFKSTPAVDEIVRRLCLMQDKGADIAKIAVMPENKKQLLELLMATETMNSEYARVPIVTISMGKLGALSRVCGQVFGSAITFASLDRESAPGQIPLGELNDLLREVDKYM